MLAKGDARMVPGDSGAHHSNINRPSCERRDRSHMLSYQYLPIPSSARKRITTDRSCGRGRNASL